MICDTENCGGLAWHDVDGGAGYRHFCAACAAQVIQAAWPAGLPVGETVSEEGAEA